jgi:pimeloyl-ACP methyl ester carboxylesterase
MRVTNDGAQIDVRIDGAGDRAVVMLAGFPLTREIWNEQANALASTHRVIRPDLRGTGASAVSAGPYLMESLAGDVAAALDSQGIERATLIGHSVGGYVSLAFARMYSERVDGIALVCSRLDAMAPEAAAARFELAARAEASGSNSEIIDVMIGSMLAPETLANRPDVVARYREIAEKNDARGLAALARGIAMRDSSDDIAPELEMPVLVVAGQNDQSVSLDIARAVASAFPNGRLAICAKSGHCPMLEEPARFLANGWQPCPTAEQVKDEESADHERGEHRGDHHDFEHDR